MWGAIKSIFGVVANPITEITKELIDTPLEKAQAQVLKVKALDPNGQMRREIAKTVTHLYKVYIYVAMVLFFAQSFDLGNANQIQLAINKIVELFVPITAMFTAIVSASFGVNVSNNIKDIKLGNKDS